MYTGGINGHMVTCNCYKIIKEVEYNYAHRPYSTIFLPFFWVCKPNNIVI